MNMAGDGIYVPSISNWNPSSGIKTIATLAMSPYTGGLPGRQFVARPAIVVIVAGLDHAHRLPILLQHVAILEQALECHGAPLHHWPLAPNFCSRGSAPS